MSIIKGIITRLFYRTETDVLMNVIAISIENTLEVVAAVIITIAFSVQVRREMTTSIIMLATEGLKILIGIEIIVFATITFREALKETISMLERIRFLKE